MHSRVYDRTVLRALEETETAFVGYAQSRAAPRGRRRRIDRVARAAELARVQYREGALDFLRLLDAERTALQAEDAVATAETDLNTSVVVIYKALGGGWEAAPGSTIVRLRDGCAARGRTQDEHSMVIGFSRAARRGSGGVGTRG